MQMRNWRPGSRTASTWRTWTLGLAALLLMVAGCRPTEMRTEEATEVVRRFFAALPDGDCAVLGPLLETGSAARPCAEVVEELNRHGVRLREVLSAQQDGRTPDAVLVRTHLERDGTPGAQPSLLRVERRGGTWRLRL